MLYMDDTLDKEDVLTIFEELEVQNFVNLVLVETTFPQNFVVDERPTTIFPPALHVTDNYACELRPSKQTRIILVYILVLGSIKSSPTFRSVLATAVQTPPLRPPARLIKHYPNNRCCKIRCTRVIPSTYVIPNEICVVMFNA